VISWIVASNQPDVLEANLLASLPDQDGDEVIIVPDPESITEAYAYGQGKASRPIRVYVHSDVQILDPAKLRRALRTACHEAGMVGVIGSRTAVMPWWEGDKLGSVVDARLGLLDFGPGGPCAVVDGLLLATVHHVDWDLDWPGFHGYDQDSCQQMLGRGLRNWCLTGGHNLVRHNTTGSTDTSQLTGWSEAVQRFRAKWPSNQGERHG
jgi:hypothetical protein